MKRKNCIQMVALLVTMVMGLAAHSQPQWLRKTEDPEYLHRAVKLLTDIMVHDIYSPPVASRTYAYVSVAAYETLVPSNSNYVSLAGRVHGLQPAPAPVPAVQYSFTLAAVQAMLTVGKSMVISEAVMDNFRQTVIQTMKADGMPGSVMDSSLAYGSRVAAHILSWAAADHYLQTRSLPKYAVNNAPGYWKPTPPAYIKAVEPHWNQLRPFLIDAAQFKPSPPPSFSTDTASRFYKEANAVYYAGKGLTSEQTAIASFWDCNPFKVNLRGHVMFATKKISPGGHWINITAMACRQLQKDVVATAEAYAFAAIGIADAFISCWDEKYRSNVIRPETYINQYIDVDWLPLLQTPPFPEYTSGHSVVSACAAEILTSLFGDHFSYVDATETEFDLPPRRFSSFRQAAEEAAISRFYGGIHYMPSIKNGLDEGTAIGKYVVEKLNIKQGTF
ncbi:phosphatidic acid phosphatase [Niabella soli DSM 19437]|uniref:Phosphatidic acid phosphatase n=2 Tax=Niabella TaxID=379899 RepID=W0F5T5_9BACT|nr:phosphatidic acid phosphatase [Niabella soli DSM 19437]